VLRSLDFTTVNMTAFHSTQGSVCPAEGRFWAWAAVDVANRIGCNIELIAQNRPPASASPSGAFGITD
jgi:hypothetical protein